jgi:hypothetical protein
MHLKMDTTTSTDSQQATSTISSQIAVSSHPSRSAPTVSETYRKMVEKAYDFPKAPQRDGKPIRIDGDTISKVDSSNIRDHERTLKSAFTSFLQNQEVRERFSGILKSDEDIEFVSNQTYEELESAMTDIYNSMTDHERECYPKAWKIRPVLSSLLCNSKDDTDAWTKIHVAGLGVIATPISDDNATKIKFPQAYLTQEIWFVKDIERPRPGTQSVDQDHGDSTTSRADGDSTTSLTDGDSTSSRTDTSGLFAKELDKTDASPFQQSNQDETSSAPGATDTDDFDESSDAEGLELHRCASRS